MSIFFPRATARQSLSFTSCSTSSRSEGVRLENRESRMFRMDLAISSRRCLVLRIFSRSDMVIASKINNIKNKAKNFNLPGCAESAAFLFSRNIMGETKNVGDTGKKRSVEGLLNGQTEGRRGHFQRVRKKAPLFLPIKSRYKWECRLGLFFLFILNSVT